MNLRRRFDAKVRKVGNSYVITLPIETVERFGLQEEVLEVSIKIPMEAEE